MSLAVAGVAAAVVLVLPAIGHELRLTILAALLLVLLVGQANARDLAMRGMNLQLISQLPMLILRPGTFLVLLLVAFAALGTLSAPQAMLLHAAAMVVVLLAISILFWRHTPRMRLERTVPFDARAALRAALPMGMTEGLRVVNGHLAVFIIGAMVDAGSVGLFKVADSIGTLCALPISILNIVAAPQIARLNAANDVRRMKKLVSTVALGMTLGALALALSMVFFGSDIVALLFGPAFADALVPMLILCLGYAAGAMLGPSIVFMNMTGRERTVARGIAVSFGANLVLGTILISTAGVVGAALANVAAYFIWYGWLWWEAKRQADVDTSLVPAVVELLSRRARS
jgi:O-antigen/teichoic acid export membrane protein